MNSTPNIYTDIAESILEHAASITRLDAEVMGDAAYEATYASHVNAIRLIAVTHVDPHPDRELVRQLKALSGNVSGVFVQLTDGALQLIIDTVSMQHKFKLWTQRQILKNEEDEFMDY
jgi:hypothetical protein